MKYNLSIEEKKFEVVVGDIREGIAQVTVNGVSYNVRIDSPLSTFTGKGEQKTSAAPHVVMASPASSPKTVQAQIQTPAEPARPIVSTDSHVIKAPIPGLILEVKVKTGDLIQAGQVVATMEAMKMENRLTSHITGIVKEIFVQKGSEVSTGDLIMMIG